VRGPARGGLPPKGPRQHGVVRARVYRMQSPDGTPLGTGDTITIAPFSDCGTGEYQSLYIARALAAHAPHYAIHPGDVYYAGTRSEIRDHLDKPLRPLLRKLEPTPGGVNVSYRDWLDRELRTFTF
jgi:hypothetical protein